MSKHDNRVVAKFGPDGTRKVRANPSASPEEEFTKVVQAVFDFLQGQVSPQQSGKQTDCTGSLFTRVTFHQGDNGAELAVVTSVTLHQLRSNDVALLSEAFSKAVVAFLRR